MAYGLSETFCGDSLELSTMMMFISHKSKLHQANFESTDTVFDLGEGQLW